MKKELIGVTISKLPKPRVERPPQWWVGIATLFGVLAVGLVIAVCIQAGMGATVDLDAKFLYNACYIFGFPGIAATGLIENNGHLPTYYLLTHESQIICVAVNAVVYGALFLAWVMHHGDDRLKK